MIENASNQQCAAMGNTPVSPLLWVALCQLQTYTHISGPVIYWTFYYFNISTMTTAQNHLSTTLEKVLIAFLLFCRICHRSSLQPVEVLSACVQI